MSQPTYPKRFYVHDQEISQFVRVKAKPVSIPGMDSFDLFMHRGYGEFNKDRWTISEGKTGGAIITRFTKEQAIADAERLYPLMSKHGHKPLEEQIACNTEKYGLSPRWKP